MKYTVQWSADIDGVFSFDDEEMEYNNCDDPREYAYLCALDALSDHEYDISGPHIDGFVGEE